MTILYSTEKNRPFGTTTLQHTQLSKAKNQKTRELCDLTSSPSWHHLVWPVVGCVPNAAEMNILYIRLNWGLQYTAQISQLNVQCSVIHCSAVQGRAVKCSKVQCCVQFSNAQYSIVQNTEKRIVQYSVVEFSKVQYSVVQCSTVQYSVFQCSRVQYSKLPVCNTRSLRTPPNLGGPGKYKGIWNLKEIR